MKAYPWSTTGLRFRFPSPASDLGVNGRHRGVAAAHPSYGPDHGYDVTLPGAPTTQQSVCITAVHVGDAADTTSCQTVDAVTGFNATAITYDTAHAQITGTSLDELDKVTNTNNTTVQQSTTISNQKQVTAKQAWSDTYGIKVTVGTELKAGFPIFAEGKVSVSVEGSASFQQNGETTTQTTYTWQQPVIVPAQSTVVAVVAVTDTTLTVPYTMTGDVVYASGAQAPYSINGTYTGTNSNDLQVTLTQYNLDGTPAANPVQQPAATLLQQS